MSTNVKVCSNALLTLGADPINSFDDLTGRQRAAAELYPQIRDRVLRAHPWNCATKRVVLSPDSVPPAFGWTNSFLLPADYLRVLSIGVDGCGIPDHLVEGRALLFNSSVVYLRYIFRNDNPATWDASLYDAMVSAMAVVLAVPTTGDRGKRADAETAYLQSMKEARAVDGQENPPESLNDFFLLGARSGRSGPGRGGR